MLPGLAGEGKYVRHDGVSDFIRREFEKVLGTGIAKEDIFYWVYGALHSPRYRETFAADLKKQLPRLPLPEDRPSFERVLKIGRALARLHLNYEEVEPWPLEEVVAPGARASWRVEKLRFAKKGGAEDRSAIVVNPTLRLEGIPEEAYGYVVNGRSGVEWVMDRYQVRRDAESGIVNDPNKWGEEHGNARYIVDLIGRVVRVGVESSRLVAQIDEPTGGKEGQVIYKKVDGADDWLMVAEGPVEWRENNDE
jgi:predicted helicase